MNGQTVSDLKFKDSKGKYVKVSEVNVNVEFQFRVVEKMSEVKSNDHLVVIADFQKKNIKIDGEYRQLANGVAIYKGLTSFLDHDNGEGWYGATTGIHEIITHNLGLEHDDSFPNSYFGITTGKGVGIFSNNIKDSELKEIISNIDRGKLNQGSNSKFLYGSKIPNTNVNFKNSDASQVIEDNKLIGNAQKKQ